MKQMLEFRDIPWAYSRRARRVALLGENRLNFEVPFLTGTSFTLKRHEPPIGARASIQGSESLCAAKIALLLTVSDNPSDTREYMPKMEAARV